MDKKVTLHYLLNKKVILITGSSSGIGYLSALTFARNGWTTYASVRNSDDEGAQKLKQIATSENLLLNILEIDVTKQETINHSVQQILAEQNQIDLLINNAGFGYKGGVADLSIDQLKDQYETNVYGAVRMIQAVVPTMKTQKSGKIVNISSIQGLSPTPYFGFYSSSKFALESLSEALSYELTPFNIKVVLIEPGSFATNFNKNLKSNLEKSDGFKSVRKLVGLGKSPDAQIVVDKIFSVANKKSPKLRYLIGTDAHLIYLVRKIVPHEILKRVYSKIFKS